MRRVTLFLAVLVLLTGCVSVYAKDYEMTKKVGEYTVLVTIDKNPPVTGINKMMISIQDAKGVITDAVVAIDYGMPAMPGMPPMNYKTTGVLKGKSYLASINFSTAGPWSVVVKITRGGKTQSVKLNVDVK
jgi:uncharacterized protein YceK